MYIVIVDMRESNGKTVTINDEDGNITLFETYEQAIDLMSNHFMNTFPVIFIDLDGDGG